MWRCGLLWLVLLLVGACGDKTSTNTTNNISGPLGVCPVLVLPSGQEVRVTAATGAVVTIGGITYTVNADCSTTTTTTSVPVAEVAR